MYVINGVFEQEFIVNENRVRRVQRITYARMTIVYMVKLYCANGLKTLNNPALYDVKMKMLDNDLQEKLDLQNNFTVCQTSRM